MNLTDTAIERVRKTVREELEPAGADIRSEVQRLDKRFPMSLLLLWLTFAACADNRPPVADAPFPLWAAKPDNSTVVPDLNAFFSDPDGDPLTYEGISQNSEIEVKTETGPRHTKLIVTPIGVPPQTATILVTAYDPSGDSVAQTLNLVFPSYPILPITAQTRDTTVARGHVVELAFEPWKPESDICVDGNPVASPWLPCDDFRAAGWLIYGNRAFADLLAELECDDDSGTSGLTGCWSVTVWSRGTGPGLRDLGGLQWLIEEDCRDTWASYTLVRFVGRRSIVFPKHRIFTDTTRITVPCAGQ